MLGAYDLVVVAALVVGYLVGRSKGFLWQLSGILTLVLGYLAALVGSHAVARAFPGEWPLDLRRFAAWAGIYAGVSIGVYLVFLRLSKRIKELEWELDRRFGGALGALKAGLLVLLASLVAVGASERARIVVRSSPSGRVLARAGVCLRFLLPEKIGDAMGDCLDALGPATPPAVAPSPAPTSPVRPVLTPRPIAAASPAPLPTARPARPVPSPRSTPSRPTPPVEEPSPADDPEASDEPGPQKPHENAPPRRSHDEDALDPLAPPRR